MHNTEKSSSQSMETDQKQRGLMRNKLVMTLSKFTKRNGNNKVRPTQLSNNRNGSVSYLTTHPDVTNSSSLQKAVSTSSKVNCLREESGYANNGPYDYYGSGDENVDMRAAKYILYVKERFKQERVE